MSTIPTQTTSTNPIPGPVTPTVIIPTPINPTLVVPTVIVPTRTIPAPTFPDPTFASSAIGLYTAAVVEEGARFAAVAEAGDLDAPIAACPGWDLRELVKHVGMVHLWAAANIVYPSDRWLSVDDLDDLQPYWPEHTTGWPPDSGLVDWYRSTLSTLVRVFESTPIDHQCLTFLPAASPLTMWARRQASEIAVHRFDAEAARGRTSSFDVPFALDMLDELVSGFAPRMRTVGLEREHVLHVAVDDADRDFVITMGPAGVRTIDSASAGDADLRVSGSAADLYVLLWNRPPGPTIRLAGDTTTLAVWQDTCRIEWL